MSALFNFQSLLLVLLLVICTSTYAHATFPKIMDRNREGLFGIFWKCARVGERLSPYVGLCCVVMAAVAMIENWKLEMVHEVNRIFHNRSISDAAREAGIRQTYEFYRLARHVSTNQLNAVESTRDSVEKWLTGLVAPSSHEPDEAANPVYIRQCGMMTHTQKTQVMVLARSFLKDPWAATKPDGHEARLIAVAEACRTNGLPNEIISMVLDRVQPLDMYRRRFAKPGQQRWLHP